MGRYEVNFHDMVLNEYRTNNERAIRKLDANTVKPREDRFGDIDKFLEGTRKTRFFGNVVNQNSWLAHTYILHNGILELNWQVVITGIINNHVALLKYDGSPSRQRD